METVCFYAEKTEVKDLQMNVLNHSGLVIVKAMKEVVERQMEIYGTKGMWRYGVMEDCPIGNESAFNNK